MNTDIRTVEELVVLCEPDGSAAGTAPKATVHDHKTPLHLAFSCYLFDASGRTLTSRRAYGKRTFPGVRTNSCCGHPGPGEDLTAAVRRRLQLELGVTPVSVDLLLPEFRYRAMAEDGTVENELCPVFRAIVATADVDLDPTEVDEAWWTPWPEFVARASAGDSDPLSPWAGAQVPELVALGPEPLSWPVGRSESLPAAARR